MFDIDNLKKTEMKFLIALFIIVQLILLLTSYRSEKLICNFEEQSCTVERYTYYFTKDTITLINPNDIKDVVAQRTTIAGRRHRRTAYTPVFRNNKDEFLYIFDGKYRNYSEAKEKAEEIKRKLAEGNNIIEITR